MNATNMRNIGLVLAVALVVYLVWMHMQTARKTGPTVVGGPYSLETDNAAGDNGGAAHFNDQMNLVAGNPDF